MPVVALDHVQLAMPEALAGHGGAWLQCGGIQVHLGVENGFRPAKKAHPAFLVEQFEELIARLQREGFKIIEDTSLPGVGRAFTSDPFGNRIELVASDVAA